MEFIIGLIVVSCLGLYVVYLTTPGPRGKDPFFAQDVETMGRYLSSQDNIIELSERMKNV